MSACLVPLPRQTILPMFSQVETSIREENFLKALLKSAKKPRLINPRPRVFQDNVDSLLDLPLFGDISFTELAHISEIESVDVSDALRIDEDSAVEDRAALLRCFDQELSLGLLERNIQLLAGVGNGQEKKEILDWINSPRLYGYRKVCIDGEVVQQKVWAEDIPFTFHRCVKLSNADPDEFRDFLFSNIKLPIFQ